MKRIVFFIIILAMMSACKTLRSVSTVIEASGGSTVDSVASSSMSIDAASWTATNDSTVSSSIRYDVLRDSVGQPMLDSLGTPITYIIQRDTIWRVVSIDKGEIASMHQHDTIQVTRHDTIVVKEQVESKTKTGVANSFVFHVLLLILILCCTLIAIRRVLD